MAKSCKLAAERLHLLRDVAFDKVIDIAASFDGSWCSRIAARDGVVAAIAEETGKVLDAVFRTNKCDYCSKLENQRDKGDIALVEFLERLVLACSISQFYSEMH